MVNLANRIVGKQPHRTCIICRGKFPKDALTRYVLRDAGLIADVSQSMNGRGCYCCSKQTCLSQMDLPEKRLKKIFRLI